MKPSGPLTEMEKRVFGEHAVRDPLTGIPQERGIGSAHHEAQIAEAERIEAQRRAAIAERTPQPQPQPPAHQRVIDPRLVHPFPDRMQ
jgi:hypothetical protein